MKTVLFVPGFKEDITSRDYVKTLKVIEDAGYKVKFVPINWNRTTIKHWVKELDEVYKNYDPKNTILAGFSFGAVTAFVLAANRNPSDVWLFSLSPYFHEDQLSTGFRRSWVRGIGHRRGDSFNELQFTKLVKSISSNMIFFYGETELKSWSDITYRHKVVEKIPHAKEIFIAKAKHDVVSDEYIQAIKNTI